MHRDEFYHCPRCACGLDARDGRLHCGRCLGTLMLEPQLIDHIRTEQALALLKPRSWRGDDAETMPSFAEGLGPPIASSEPTLGCPRCGSAMTKHVFYQVTIDRCAAHGVWLDGDHELRAVIGGATRDFT